MPRLGHHAARPVEEGLTLLVEVAVADAAHARLLHVDHQRVGLCAPGCWKSRMVVGTVVPNAVRPTTQTTVPGLSVAATPRRRRDRCAPMR